MSETATGSLAELEALARGREKIVSELRKVIVGQDQVVDELLIALFCRGHCLLVGVPGLAKTLLISHAGASARPQLQPHPVHAGPDAVATSPAPRSSRTTRPPAAASSGSSTARSSPTSCWPTRSTAPRPRPRPRCWRPCRSSRSPPAARRIALPEPVLRARHPEPDRAGRAPIRCPRPSSTASCSTCIVGYPERRGRGRDRPEHHDARTRPSSPACSRRRRDPAAARSSCAACPWPTTSSTTRCGWPAPRDRGTREAAGLRSATTCRWGAGPRAAST